MAEYRDPKVTKPTGSKGSSIGKWIGIAIAVLVVLFLLGWLLGWFADDDATVATEESRAPVIVEDTVPATGNDADSDMSVEIIEPGEAPPVAADGANTETTTVPIQDPAGTPAN
ncbi:hypothetical protein E4191_18355 (plasmid) [Paracoccus liaowanqingii]|uniref:Uncharacterized protein n=1 Tax=Paracoccus liaowanqingii TaxID=2560053 RepID=A0A4Y5ST74_9RHOB|nr:hypothetical protein [Paracoccus liaowanqingii]QDA36088.1 hypothetical protein E4191_18355 [Paracoccus liaowanqingii]